MISTLATRVRAPRKVLNPSIGLEAHDRGCVRSALIDGNHLGYFVPVDGSLEECPGCGLISFGALQGFDRICRCSRPRGVGTCIGLRL